MASNGGRGGRGNCKPRDRSRNRSTSEGKAREERERERSFISIRRNFSFRILFFLFFPEEEKLSNLRREFLNP